MWTPIPGFDGYEITRDGRVRSWRRRERTWRGYHPPRRDEPVEMTHQISAYGYPMLVLRLPNGTPTSRTIHRLLALAFLPPPMPGQTDVCHNDGNPMNYSLDNLRWDTHQANQMDMRKHGTMQDGEKCITAKIKLEDVAEIRAFAASYGRGSGVLLAKKYGLSKAQISRIVNATRWRAA